MQYTSALASYSFKQRKNSYRYLKKGSVSHRDDVVYTWNIWYGRCNLKAVKQLCNTVHRPFECLTLQKPTSYGN